MSLVHNNDTKKIKSTTLYLLIINPLHFEYLTSDTFLCFILYVMNANLKLNAYF